MKIVVLDGYAGNPGDSSWDRLEEMGDVTVYPRTPKGQVVPRIGGAQVVLTNKVAITAEVMQQCPQLQYIGVLATGYNVVDVKAARQKKIVVTNIPAYSTKSVSQFVFALLLEICNHVAGHSETVHQGAWTHCLDWSFQQFPLRELSGKTMGIVGYGQIGRQTAQIASAFGMDILVHSKSKIQDSAFAVRQCPLEELLASSDVVSLHCPLTKETEEMICAASLACMKKESILINTARGGLINEQDLADALHAGRIFAAGLDVVLQEPMRADNPLQGAKNCVITPHIAWAPKESRTRLMEIAISNVNAFLQGAPINVVNA